MSWGLPMSKTLASDSTRVSEKSPTGRGAHYPGLTPIEKRSIFLILLGTFLEYFDLVLYMHLAVVLNPLFFPSTDPWVAGLLGVFAFSSAYLLRPLGAFVFGYVGDKKGRKASIVWTSGLMGCAVLTIACLPPYASIGLTASIFFIFARLLQGFSSIGEMISAQVFTAEISAKSAYADFLSVLPATTIIIGSMTALGVAAFCLHLDPVNGWRWPFFLGAFVAIIGGFIRLRAIESPAFLAVQKQKREPTTKETLAFFRTLAVRKKNYWYYFGIETITPLTLYFTLRSCSDLLKGMGFNATHIISHNFIMTGVNLLFVILWGWLTLKYDPLTILKRRFLVGFFLIPPLMWALASFPYEEVVFVVQVLLLSFVAGSMIPAQFKIIQAFPVVGRCTNLGSAYAFSHTAMYVITSLFVFSLDQTFGLWGVGALFMVTTAIAIFCASQFTPEEKLPPFQFPQEDKTVIPPERAHVLGA